MYLVVRCEGEDRELLIEDDHLVVLERVWHAVTLVHDLRPPGIAARMGKMPLCRLNCLPRGMDLGLRVLRHDSTITSMDEVAMT